MRKSHYVLRTLTSWCGAAFKATLGPTCRRLDGLDELVLQCLRAASPGEGKLRQRSRRFVGEKPQEQQL